jgi:predicted Zn-ribbon and HTH transcriptional regulator
MKCEWCTYRDKKNLETCKNCPDYNPSEMTKPRWDLEKIDIFEVAEKSYHKEILEGWQSRKAKIPTLSDCPECKKYTLQFDAIYNWFECRNKECPLFGKLIRHPSELFRQIATKLLEPE